MLLKANVSLSQFSWKAVLQLRSCSCETSVSSCCMFVSQRTSLMWQNAADDDLHRRPTGSRRLDRLEPFRTVAGRPGWPSWNPPDVEPEGSAALVALAWCGRNVECPAPDTKRAAAFWTDCNRLIRPFGDAVKQWVAVVQTTRNERLDQAFINLSILYGHGSAWHRS